MTNLTIRCDMGVKLMQHMGSDSAIVAAARVSTQGPESAAAFDAEGGAGLIGYLMRNKHGTPFEHGSLTFLVEAPIMVFREWHRHRSGWSYNEESGRYKHLAPVFWVPSSDRPLIQVGKPGQYRFEQGDIGQQEYAQNELTRSYGTAYRAYERMLAAGIAREVARACLPVAIYSSMYATCNPRSLMHFLSLRTRDDRAAHPSTPQAEIEECAKKMEAIFAEHWPLTYAAFNEHGRIAP